MVQLNPYEVRMGTQKADSYYIVAVATREDCRHQGRMRRILTEALQYMDQEKIGKFIARRRKERGLLQKEIEPIRRRTPPDHPGI